MWLAVIMVAAFVVRLIALDQPLWLDEATTARVVARYSPSQILSVFSPTDFHPPLYYLFMDLWTSVFGYGEVALRMPSVLFSLIAGYYVYKSVAMSRSVAAARWAAAYFLFNPLIVYYSQEARMYMAVVMLAVMLYYYVLQLPARPHSLRAIIVANILIVLLLLTFYGSIFFVLAVFLYIAVKKRQDIAVRLSAGPLAALALCGSLFISQLRNSGEQLHAVLNWSSVLGTARVKNLALFPLKFITGRISWEPKSTYYLAAGVWSLAVYGPIVYFIRDNYRKKKLNIKTPVFFIIIPIMFGAIVSLYKPMLQYFRFIYVVPFLCIVMAVAVEKKVWLRREFLAGFIVFAMAYLVNPSFHREDWRQLARQLPPVATIYMIPSSADPILYYRPTFIIKDIRTESALPDSLYVIPYTTDIHGFDYRSHLTRLGYFQQRTISVRGVSAELWSKHKRFASGLSSDRRDKRLQKT